jgi:hypothetical protein
MVIMKNRPKLIDSEYVDKLHKIGIQNGNYVMIQDSIILSELNPNYSDINKIAFSTVAASGPYVSTSNDPKYYPQGTVYFIRNIRRDNQPDKSHVNTDDRLIWADKNGNCWQLSKEDNPDHYKNISATAGFEVIAKEYNLPEKNSGTFEDYRKPGGNLNFNTKG